MLNNNLESSKLKSKKFCNKTLAFFLVSAIGLSSGAVFTGFDIDKVSAAQKLRYFNDDQYLSQTHLMMDGNNFLKDGYWMHVKLTPIETDQTPNPTTFSATLEFTIPGYDLNNLKFYVLDKNPSRGTPVMEYQLSNGGEGSQVQELYLPNLTQTTYDVHVYNGSLATENFVCKADFCVTNKVMNTTVDVDLLDSNGNPMVVNNNNLKLTYFKKHQLSGDKQTCLSLPLSVVPYNSRTVKVVFFATDRGGESINIDQTLFDYMWSNESENLANGGFLRYYPEANWGTDPSTVYEAHFYRDEVKEGNFICKAEGITLR